MMTSSCISVSSARNSNRIDMAMIGNCFGCIVACSLWQATVDLGKNKVFYYKK